MQHIARKKQTLNYVISLVILLITASYSSIGLAAKSQNQYQQLGETVANAINQQNSEAIAEHLALNKFAEIVAKQIFDKPKDIRDFVKGFTQSGKLHFVNQIMSTVYPRNGQAKYLRTFDNTQPLVRVDFPDGGHEYMLLITGKNRQEKLEIVDMFLLSSGSKLSVKVSSMTELIIKPEQSLLKTLLNVKEVDEALLEKIKAILANRNQGKLDKAYQQLQELPAEIKHARAMIDLGLQLTQQFSDQEYRKQLSLLDKYYGSNDSTQFMLIDHHFFNEEFDKALVSIKTVSDKYGEDAALTNLKASVYFAQGQHPKARQAALHAITLEPDFEAAYWTLVSVQNLQKDYVSVIETLSSLKDLFGYQFTKENFLNEAFYQEFSQSTEFENWQIN